MPAFNYYFYAMIKKIIIIILFAFSLYAQQSPLDQNQFMLAQSYEQRGDFAKAVEIIETLNKKDPTNIQYFNKLNSLYLQLKKYDESAALINSRISITPQDISLYGLLGSHIILREIAQKLTRFGMILLKSLKQTQ